ncbi:E3 ubiquitin-protein ligase MARCHF2-like isoform X1 [Gigantopelta aegis]|uniref:E3 ubiquitin-protein ligase MARCHF2-like isoform X1 n=1 Tax=Gigantopelta aegis TaxID=1735272 RepID=UPI001B888687|nr:E3 ubiquitin-protein ligase MARCHF2-like isoform X1 [Gigantopelta aegis]
MEEEASCPALMASNSEGSRKSRLTGNSGSSTSIKCRICQLTESETGEPVKTSDCRCKRDLASVHRSCLTDWVNYKGNNTCEVCKAPFANVPAPILTENIDGEQTVRDELLRVYSTLRPMTLEKRVKMCAGLFVVVVIMSAIAISIFTKLLYHQWSMGIAQEKRRLHIALMLYAFCVLSGLSIATACVWFALEMRYVYHRRAIYRQAVQMALQYDFDDTSQYGFENRNNSTGSSGPPVCSV